MRLSALLVVPALVVVPVLAISSGLIAAPMESANANRPAEAVIEVSGIGEIQAAPDQASADFAIVTHASTAADAAKQNAELAAKVLAAVKSKLASNGEAATGSYSLIPEYRQHPGEEGGRIVGYTAQNSIHVETGKLDLVGPLVDAAISAGANRVNSVNFTLKNNSRARSAAIAAAAHDAQIQARALAAALGVKLKRVIKASTESEIRPVPMMRAMAATMGAQTPIEAGELTIPARVSVTYEIE